VVGASGILSLVRIGRTNPNPNPNPSPDPNPNPNPSPNPNPYPYPTPTPNQVLMGCVCGYGFWPMIVNVEQVLS